MPRSQSPEHSPECPSEDEGKEERNWREEAKEEEEEEAKLKDTLKTAEEHEELCPRKRPVSKSLMDTLWAKFKLSACPTVQDRLSLSFEFSMTDKQIQQWFSKKRKKYMKELSEQKRSKRLKNKKASTHKTSKLQ
ncbi:NANOG neighbor homeobox [Marmota marmota marmota]|uniref:NANOG neighbor homeobox n=1 Tax=Marmota marmota marmota TaxID=9994 RepID=UPI002093401B|nr:NANOG neighbor homeobox [Marmota marmota marmota]